MFTNLISGLLVVALKKYVASPYICKTSPSVPIEVTPAKVVTLGCATVAKVPVNAPVTVTAPAKVASKLLSRVSDSSDTLSASFVYCHISELWY